MKIKGFYPCAALFFGFTAAVTALDLASPVRDFSEMENRSLKTGAGFSFEEALSGKFQSRYEEVVADQFVWRDSWITIKSVAESALLKTENNGVIYGKNGALFGKLTSYDEERFFENVALISDFAKEHENVTVSIIPSGYTYSSDELPLGCGQLDERPVIQKAAETLSESAECFDADALLSSANSEDLYYRTDHHWKGTTAYLFYSAVCGDLGLDPVSTDGLTLKEIDGFYGSYYSKCKKAGTKPDTLNFYEPSFSVKAEINGEEKDGWYDPEQLTKRDKYGALLYGNSGLTVLSRSGSASESTSVSRLLIIKDSFANPLAPLFLYNFDEVYVVDLRTYPSGLNALCEEKDFDDILIMYNFENLESDANFYRLFE